MLALIQRPIDTTKIKLELISKADCKKLRVLDALAGLLVREHKKVAIMVKLYNGKSIQVISIVHLNNPGSTVRNSGIQWLASLNSHYTPPMFPENDEDLLQVVDPNTRAPQMLSEHKDDPEKLFHTLFLTQW